MEVSYKRLCIATCFSSYVRYVSKEVYIDIWITFHNDGMSSVDMQHVAYNRCEPLNHGPEDPEKSQAMSRQHSDEVLVFETVMFYFF